MDQLIHNLNFESSIRQVKIGLEHGECFKVSKTVTDNNNTLANHFKNFCTSVADKLLQKLSKRAKRFKWFRKLCWWEICFIWPTNIEEVVDLIKLLELHRAAVPNTITTRILKNFKQQLSIPLSQLINLSFNKGAFPNSRKLVKVIPIHKRVTRQY